MRHIFYYKLYCILSLCLLASFNSIAQVNENLPNNNIGIGTATALDNAKLTVKGNDGSRWQMLALDGKTDDWFMGSFGGGGFFISQNSFASSNTRLAIIDDKIGIGTNSPAYRLTVNTADENHFRLENGNEIGFMKLLDNGDLNMWVHGDDAMIFSRGNGAGLESMRISSVGSVGIGTTNPSHKLDVNGTIHAKEVLVDLNFPGPDYVFEEDYELTSLSEVDQYLKENKHLPEVPSAAEMEKEGVNMVEMDMLLLKKVEELTLHLIDLKNENNSQQKEIELLKSLLK